MEKNASSSTDAPISAVIAGIVAPYTRPDTQDLDEARRVAREVLAAFAPCAYGCQGFNGVVDATCSSCLDQVRA